MVLLFARAWCAFRHVGDASNELGQHLHRRAISAPIITSPVPPTDEAAVAEVHTAFRASVLLPCQEVDFFYQEALSLFSSLCGEPMQTSALCAASGAADQPNSDDEAADSRNKMTVQCNMSSLRRSLSSRLADALLAQLLLPKAAPPAVSSLREQLAGDLTHPILPGKDDKRLSTATASAVARAMAEVLPMQSEGKKTDNSGGGNKKKKTARKQSRTPSSSSGPVESFMESGRSPSSLRLMSPLQYLDDAIAMCIEDHIETPQGSRQPGGFVLQSECGMNYLAKGGSLTCAYRCAHGHHSSSGDISVLHEKTGLCMMCAAMC